MTPKEQRRAIYQWLASEGFTFNKERHRRLKQLLQGKVEEEPQYLDDNDPNLLGPEGEDEETSR
jgi:hypothetical protein